MTPNWSGSLLSSGGEDVYAERTTFRSVNEAARWGERVLDRKIKPRWRPSSHSTIDHPHGPVDVGFAVIAYVDETGDEDDEILCHLVVGSDEWEPGDY